MGTELGFRGAPLSSSSWSAAALGTHPELVAQIHTEYARAGATVHTANTFRVQPHVLGAHFERVVTQAVALARKAVPKDHRVLGSMAPVRDCYRPDLAPEDKVAREVHEAMAQAMFAAGVDGVLCETFACPREALVAIGAARTLGLSVWAGLTAGPDGSLLSPAELARAAERCARAGAALVFANCIDYRLCLPYAEALRAVGVPFGIYANAGVSASGELAPASISAAAAYAQAALHWREAGALALGGCCGTGPLHIEHLAEL
jgi:S-methylmethionine-dependent homocysteine/selenocysteine methylase